MSWGQVSFEVFCYVLGRWVDIIEVGFVDLERPSETIFVFWNVTADVSPWCGLSLSTEAGLWVSLDAGLEVGL